MSSTTFTHATIYDGTIGGITTDGCLRIDDATITHIGSGADYESWPASDRHVNCAGAPLVPGYIDIHHHGGGGVAYDEGYEQTAQATAAHRAHGTTRCLISFVTDALPTMEQRMQTVLPLVESDPHILGIHAEGPFLDPAHKGAHPEQELIDPVPDAVRRIYDAAGGWLKQITIAPEKPHGMEAIDWLVAHGVKASVGHTNATFEQAKEAFDHGATILTHAFNAMNGIHHRAPGPVIAALHDDRVWVEIINDTIHVHPDVVEMLYDEVGDRLMLITDSMGAACSPDGDYMLGQLEVTVKDGVARLTHGGSLAGSTLTMDRAVANSVKAVGVSLDRAVTAATSHPATALGMEDSYGRLAVGYPADVLLLDPDTLLPRRIVSNGEDVEPAAQ